MIFGDENATKKKKFGCKCVFVRVFAKRRGYNQ